MILQSILVYMPALLAGFGLMHLFWESRGNLWSFLLKMFLGAGLGLGITSCFYFYRLAIFPGQGGFLAVELGLCVLILVALIFSRRLTLDQPIQFHRPSWMKIMFTIVALLAILWALSFSVTYARIVPHGDYDAQAIWNLRARFIYRLGDAWQNSFSHDINRDFHMDYPLLVPMNVVGGWATLGSEVQRTPAVQSMLFFYGLAGVLFCLIAYLNSSIQAALALIVLLATPLMLLITGFQSADIAVAYYFLSTFILLILAFHEENPHLLFLAGVMAALSAWTKNEGLPFLMLAGLSAWWCLRKKESRLKIRFFILGLLLPLATVFLFKILIPSSRANDLIVGNEAAEILTKLFEPSRFLVILNRLTSELAQLGDWPFSILLILVAYGLIMGVTQRNWVDRRLFMLPLWQFVVYIVIYLITPQDLEWQLNYSMERLLLHIFPMALLVFFMLVRAPEEVFGIQTADRTVK
jgi:4-amino-4-deoxy-L-arabinose transferase-like glycosyltransferase